MGRALALAVVATVVVGCAASSQVDPSGAAGGGVAGTSGAGTSGGAGSGAAGTTACVMPPVVKVTWLLSRDTTGPEITCEQAGGATIQLFMNTTRSEFACGAKWECRAASWPARTHPACCSLARKARCSRRGT